VQDKALDKLTGQDADLPRILKVKDDEIRALEELHRRSNAKAKELAAECKAKDKQIMALNDAKRALEELAGSKGLKSRKALTEQVEALTTELSVRYH